MACFEARMSTKGQVTLPAEIRHRLALREGDRVDFYIDAVTGTVSLVARNRTLADLAGIIDHAPSQLPSTSEIKTLIGQHLVEDDSRIAAEWNEFETWRRLKSVDAAE